MGVCFQHYCTFLRVLGNANDARTHARAGCGIAGTGRLRPSGRIFKQLIGDTEDVMVKVGIMVFAAVIGRAGCC